MSVPSPTPLPGLESGIAQRCGDVDAVPLPDTAHPRGSTCDPLRIETVFAFTKPARRRSPVVTLSRSMAGASTIRLAFAAGQFRPISTPAYTESRGRTDQTIAQEFCFAIESALPGKLTLVQVEDAPPSKAPKRFARTAGSAVLMVYAVIISESPRPFDLAVPGLREGPHPAATLSSSGWAGGFPLISNRRFLPATNL